MKTPLIRVHIAPRCRALPDAPITDQADVSAIYRYCALIHQSPGPPPDACGAVRRTVCSFSQGAGCHQCSSRVRLNRGSRRTGSRKRATAVPCAGATPETMTEGEFVGAWTEVSMVLAAVTGDTSSVVPSFEELVRGSGQSRPVMVRAARGVAQRDAAADRLLALGYSSREVADVLSRRISQEALDTARRMIAVGRERQLAADYLDSQYRRAFSALTPAPLRTVEAQGLLSSAFRCVHQSLCRLASG